MNYSERYNIIAVDEALHDLRAIESEAMDSLRPRCSFLGFLDLASVLSAIAQRTPDLVIVGDLPRAGFAGSGIFKKLRDAGYAGPVAILSRDPDRAFAALPAGEIIVSCVAKKDFSRGTFLEMLKSAGATRD